MQLKNPNNIMQQLGTAHGFPWAFSLQEHSQSF
jgi:hypothetical protein